MSLKSVCACLVLLMVCATAGAKQPREVVIYLTAALSITADGTVQKLTWKDKAPGLKAIAERIEPSVRKWKFVPGTLNGVPTSTDTYLTIRIKALPVEDDLMRLQFLSAHTGAESLPVVPDFPDGAGRAGDLGAVVAIVDFDARGRPSLRSYEYAGLERSRNDFVAATRAAVKRWRVNLERVGGHPVGTSLRIPFKYCLWECPSLPETNGNDTEQHDTHAVALESAVRLLTVQDPFSGS
ncbi:MAG TPA: hypothetical protein VJ484_13525 [Lysobacter sp.]|nr:hypothetical protein [Lysobacter sp.]